MDEQEKALWDRYEEADIKAAISVFEERYPHKLTDMEMDYVDVGMVEAAGYAILSLGQDGFTAQEIDEMITLVGVDQGLRALIECGLVVELEDGNFITTQNLNLSQDSISTN